jgi:hypothetical protein
MIFTNRVVRGALTALHWLFPPPTVTVTFGTRLEAYDWCIERLEETGVPVPQSVRELAGRGGVVRSTGTF